MHKRAKYSDAVMTGILGPGRRDAMLRKKGIRSDNRLLNYSTDRKSV